MLQVVSDLQFSGRVVRLGVWFPHVSRGLCAVHVAARVVYGACSALHRANCGLAGHVLQVRLDISRLHFGFELVATAELREIPLPSQSSSQNRNRNKLLGPIWKSQGTSGWS
jgi:hypothetical protein